MNENDQQQDALFVNLVLVFKNAAMQQMGKLMHPLTGKVERNLDQARFSIDTLDMLKTKTEGNLSPELGKLLDSTLLELRINYVEEVEAKAKEEPEAPEPEAAEGQEEEKQPAGAEASAEPKTAGGAAAAAETAPDEEAASKAGADKPPEDQPITSKAETSAPKKPKVRARRKAKPKGRKRAEKD